MGNDTRISKHVTHPPTDKKEPVYTEIVPSSVPDGKISNRLPKTSPSPLE